MKKYIEEKILNTIQPILDEKEKEFNCKQRAVEQKVDLLNSKIEEILQLAQHCNERLIALDNELKQQNILQQEIDKNLKNNNYEMEEYRKRFDDYSINLGNNNKEMKQHHEEMEHQRELFESYSLNLKSNNQLMDQFIVRIKEFAKRIASYERALIQMQKNIDEGRLETGVNELEVATAYNNSINKYNSIDYLDFENHFRGSREKISELQTQYLPYFKDKKHVIDIGCGRGEFLELMKKEGISAIGVDIYEDFVAYCKVLGVEAVCDDGIHYLKGIESTDGIFIGQVVEHLTIEQIIELCDVAYGKLESGSYIVIETPNPTSLAIYTNAFYIDPSHIKPIHPLTLQYCLEKSGFTDIEVLFTESSKLPELPELKCDVSINIDEFNKGIRRVSNMLFGSQDFAIIARRT